MVEIINIDLDKVLDVALKGIRRASVFMGFGVNAALDENFKAFHLTHLTNIQLLPNTVSEENMNHLKTEFRYWIEAGGFRELSETFGSFLDTVHKACSLMSGKILADIKRQNRAFRAKGLPEKLDILKNEFGVEVSHAQQIVSLNRARNCFTHRRGIVEIEDLRWEPELSVSWTGLDIFMRAGNGEKIFLNENPDGGVQVEDGRIFLEFTSRARSFPGQSKLSFSTRDLAEICWFYDREARSVLQSVIAFARKAGVVVRQSEKAI